MSFVEAAFSSQIVKHYTVKLRQPSFLFYVLFLVAIIAFEIWKRTRYFTGKNRGQLPIPTLWQVPLLGNVWQFKEIILQEFVYSVDETYRNLFKKFTNKTSWKSAIARWILHLTYPTPPNFFNNYCNFYSKTMTKVGGVCGVWILHKFYVMVTQADYIEIMLGNVRRVTKSQDYAMIGDSPLGSGLITQMDDKTWRRHRKIITPAFHFNTLKTYVPVFHEETCILMKKIESLYGRNEKQGVGADECRQGFVDVCRVPNLYPLFQLSNFDMIMHSIFGVRIHAQEQEDHPFVHALNNSFKIVQNRLVNPLLQYEWTYTISGYRSRMDRSKKICQDFTDTLIRKKRAEYQQKAKFLDADGSTPTEDGDKVGKKNDTTDDDMNVSSNTLSDKKKRNDADELRKLYQTFGKAEQLHIEYTRDHKSFLELIIEDETNQQRKMTDKEIRDNMITLMFGGQDTTASSNCVTFLMLALHQDVQTKVMEEIDAIFGGPEHDDGRVPTYAELMDLPVLDRVLKETFRLFPAVPLIGRAVTEDLPMGPYVLPKGSITLFSLMALQRDARYHERPNEFWPDRYLETTAPNYSYIPFSAGSRNCVGQKYAFLQMKTVLTTILRKWRVSSEEELKSVRDVDALLMMAITLTVIRCPLVFTRR